MSLVLNFGLTKFHDQLDAGHRTDQIHQVRDLLIGYGIAFLQPEKIEVFEFRQEVFPVELIVVKKMLKGVSRLIVFIDPEKVLPLLFCELDLELMIAAKVEAEPFVELPDQLIILDRSDDPNEPGVLEEPVGHILYVQLQLHGDCGMVYGVKVSRPCVLAPSIRS